MEDGITYTMVQKCLESGMYHRNPTQMTPVNTLHARGRVYASAFFLLKLGRSNNPWTSRVGTCRLADGSLVLYTETAGNVRHWEQLPVVQAVIPSVVHSWAKQSSLWGRLAGCSGCEQLGVANIRIVNMRILMYFVTKGLVLALLYKHIRKLKIHVRFI